MPIIRYRPIAPKILHRHARDVCDAAYAMLQGYWEEHPEGLYAGGFRYTSMSAYNLHIALNKITPMPDARLVSGGDNGQGE